MTLRLKAMKRHDKDELDRLVRIFNRALSGITLADIGAGIGISTTTVTKSIKSLVESLSLYAEEMGYVHPYSEEKYPRLWHSYGHEPDAKRYWSHVGITVDELRAEQAYWSDMLVRYVNFQRAPHVDHPVDSDTSVTLLNLSPAAFQAIREKLLDYDEKYGIGAKPKGPVTIGKLVEQMNRAPVWTTKANLLLGFNKKVHAEIKAELERRGFVLEDGNVTDVMLMAQALHYIEYPNQYGRIEKERLVRLLQDRTKGQV